MTDDEIKTLARKAVAAADAYMRHALDFDDLRRAAAQIAVPLDNEHGARLGEPLWMLAVAMERTSQRGGTHEIRWRNVMHAMAQVVRMELGEGLHPEDQPAAPTERSLTALELLLKDAMARVALLSPEQQQAMWEEQKRSWVRGEMALGLENG